MPRPEALLPSPGPKSSTPRHPRPQSRARCERNRNPAIVPRWLRGCWWRHGVEIAGCSSAAAGYALWIQGKHWFIDLRWSGPVPLGGPRLFAGYTTWAEPRLTWHHVVDTRRFFTRLGPTADDIATMTQSSSTGTSTTVTEQGALALDPGDPHRLVSYQERWGPLWPGVLTSTRSTSSSLL